MNPNLHTNSVFCVGGDGLDGSANPVHLGRS